MCDTDAVVLTADHAMQQYACCTGVPSYSAYTLPCKRADRKQSTLIAGNSFRLLNHPLPCYSGYSSAPSVAGHSPPLTQLSAVGMSYRPLHYPY